MTDKAEQIAAGRMSGRAITADKLQAGHTYRDGLGRYREVRSIVKTASSVIVTTNSGRFVMRKADEVTVI
jgi:hypothetical protein